MGWIRWWLTRLVMGRGAWREIERIIQADACTGCGSWRCLRCHNLIMVASDHAPGCKLHQPWH